MALTVTITGGENIDQGDRVTLTATVTDANGNTPPGTLQYAWSASRGSFVGETDEASAVYHADFTDADAVDVTITCNVTRPANANPTSSGPSLTALAEIGVTGILVNMFMTAVGAVATNTNNVLYNNSTGTLDAGSDQRLSSNINIFQLRWDNTNNNFVLNNNEGGHIGNFFIGNNNQSVYLIFQDGTYVELTPTDFSNGTSRGNTWARWQVTDANILARLNALTTTSDLVVGVADAGSIGWSADSGSATDTFTASVPVPLSIESIDEQFIVIGTEDYRLVIDIPGNPESAEVSGHMEGFLQDWDAANGQMHIISDEVTRLISGVNWDVKAVKGTQTLMSQIAYNVIKAAPIFQTLPTLHLYRGVEINYDILITNIPDQIIPNSVLIGVKSELAEYGMNFRGMIPEDANFSANTGNVSLIVPSDTGDVAEMYDYPYQIEAGSPPSIGAVAMEPKGHFSEIQFTDVTHALGYEWQLEGEDPNIWNFFDSARPLINPSEIEVTPGNLNVTIKFPNIANASSYEYMLESETHEVAWTRFTGTLSNNMITTIIPNLEEGVTYTLRLRVASPWIGTPVSITVRGGRVLYTVYDQDANSVFYVTHTGQPENDINFVATAVNRFFLPTGLTQPYGLAIDGNTVYCTHNRREIWVFSLDTEFDQRATLIRKFNLPAININDIAFFDDKLYILGTILRSQSGKTYNGQLYTVNANTANGATASAIDVYAFDPSISQGRAVSVSDDFIFIMNFVSTAASIRTAERQPPDYSNVSNSGKSLTGTGSFSFGAVLGNLAYVSISGGRGDVLNIADRSITSGSTVIKTYRLPLNQGTEGLDVSK